MTTTTQSKGRGAARKEGFALPDLLATAATVCMVAALAIIPFTAVKRKASLSVCTENLRQINRAVLQYSDENGKRLPMAPPSPGMDLWWGYKEMVKRYVGLTGPSSKGDKVFACPNDRGYSDPKPFHQTARFDFGSYPYNAINIGGAPNIAGYTVGAIKQPKRTLLVMEWTAHAPLSWHKSRTGKANLPFYRDAESVVGFVDGHVGLTKIYYDGYNAAFTRDPIPGYDYQYSGN